VVVNEKARTFTASGKTYKEGDMISLDGTTGYVYGEVIATQQPALTGDFETLMNWADELRVLKVRTNADSPKDAAQAVQFGAEGIGLCRTEHMFFDVDRIPAFRKMIVATNEADRRRALDTILPMQKEDFKGIYETMEGRPVTIRLLDPPLHEFLPHEDKDIQALASDLGLTFEKAMEINEKPPKPNTIPRVFMIGNMIRFRNRSYILFFSVLSTTTPASRSCWSVYPRPLRWLRALSQLFGAKPRPKLRIMRLSKPRE
jgi:phosphoenolpyruvate synthase/pyruvate phosphate dikinase